VNVLDALPVTVVLSADDFVAFLSPGCMGHSPSGCWEDERRREVEGSSVAPSYHAISLGGHSSRKPTMQNRDLPLSILMLTLASDYDSAQFWDGMLDCEAMRRVLVGVPLEAVLKKMPPSVDTLPGYSRARLGSVSRGNRPPRGE